jgi:hypothetical protein
MKDELKQYQHGDTTKIRVAFSYITKPVHPGFYRVTFAPTRLSTLKPLVYWRYWDGKQWLKGLPNGDRPCPSDEKIKTNQASHAQYVSTWIALIEVDEFLNAANWRDLTYDFPSPIIEASAEL